MIKVVGFVVLLVILVVGGVLLYRSTEPNGDTVPQGDTALEAIPAEGSSNSQFLQLGPTSAPPGEEGMVEAEEPQDTDTEVTGEESRTSMTEDEAGETVTISMTDTGFTPAQVTIKRGDTLKFVNNGQALHWPASDVHPTHEALPEFDAGQGIATGDYYEFTFLEAGTWSFHDHLHASLTGSVTVE